MTRKKKTPDKTDQMLDELLEGVENPEDITGENGLIKQLTQRLLNRALEGELTNHLGYEKNPLKGIIPEIRETAKQKRKSLPTMAKSKLMFPEIETANLILRF